MSPRFQAFLLLGCLLVGALNAAPAARVLRQGCHAYREPVPVVQRSPAPMRQPRCPVEEPLHLVVADSHRERVDRSSR